jgi:hypothetical protein
MKTVVSAWERRLAEYAIVMRRMYEQRGAGDRPAGLRVACRPHKSIVTGRLAKDEPQA